MPGINGLDLLKKIHHKLPDLPVIIMTAHSDLDSAVSSYQSGAFEYLPKPFDIDDATMLVKRGIEHSRQQRKISTGSTVGACHRNHWRGPGNAGSVQGHWPLVPFQHYSAD